MDAARDPYSKINVDSPWRWGPVVGGPLSFALMGVILATRGWSSLDTVFAVLSVVVLGLTMYSRHKLGPWESYRPAVERAREAGRNRINSRPRLAVAMLVVGIALIATSICAWFMTTDNLERPSGLLGYVRHMGCWGTGMMLAMNGWYRPWDLKVVEPESSAHAQRENLDDLAAMKAAREAYLHLKPDSAWRWVPPVVIPIMIVPTELAVRGESGRDWTFAFYVISGMAFVMLLASWFKIGSGDGFTIAAETERKTGGKRIITHPGLALAMLFVGLVMLAAWAIAVVNHRLVTDTRIDMILSSFSFPAIGYVLVMFGLQRPWDLKVVERETDEAS